MTAASRSERSTTGLRRVLTRVGAVGLGLLTAITATGPAPVAAAATPPGCTYGTTGVTAGTTSTVCWISTAGWTLSATPERRTVDVGPYRFSFDVAASGDVALAPATAPTWSRAVLGAGAYEGVGTVAVQTDRPTAAARATVTLSNLTGVDTRTGAPLGDTWGLAMVDAETTDPGEAVVFTADRPVRNLMAGAATGYLRRGDEGAPCSVVWGGTTVTCRPDEAGARGALLAYAVAPTTASISFEVGAGGRQGGAFGIVLAQAAVSVEVSGGEVAADAATVAVADTHGTLGRATTGTGRTATTGPVAAAAGDVRLSAAVPDGARSTWTCLDTSGLNLGTTPDVAPAPAGGVADVRLAVGQSLACAVAAQVPATLPVTITSPTPGQVVTAEPLTVTGRTQPGAQVVVAAPAGTPVCTTTAGADGAYACRLPVLGDGPHRLVVTATDTAGGTGSAAVDVVVAATADAPLVVTIDAPAAGALLTEAAPVVSGRTEPGARVTVATEAGDPLCEATATADGGFACTLPAAADGPRTVVVRAVDAAGHAGEASVSFRTDTTEPVLALVPPRSPSASALPTLVGTTEPGAAVVVTDADGQTVCRIDAVDETGELTCRPAAPLRDGAHEWTVTATDAAGWTTTVVVTFDVDTTGPLVTVEQPVSGAVLADATPTLSGRTEPGARVVVTGPDGSPRCEPVTAGPDGTFGCELSATADGTHTVLVAASDALGNTMTTAVTYTVDTTAPAVDVTAPGAVTGTTPVLAGVTEPGATVTVTAETGAELCRLTASPQGEFSCPAPAPLTGGRHTWTVSATDAAGNTTQQPVTFEVDTVPPVLSLVGPRSPSADGHPTLVVGAEAGTTVTVAEGERTVCGPVVVGADGTVECAPGTVADGTHTWTVVAVDRFGNRSTVETTFVVDTVAPTLTVASPTDGSATAQRVLTFAGTSEPGSQVTVTAADGSPVCGPVTVAGDGSWSCESPALADGTRTFTVAAADTVRTTTATVTVTVDTVAPVLWLVRPAAGVVTTDRTPWVVGGVDADASVTVQLADGRALCDATVDEWGSFSCRSTISLPNGTHTVVVTATDRAGNRSTTATTFRVRTPLVRVGSGRRTTIGPVPGIPMVPEVAIASPGGYGGLAATSVVVGSLIAESFLRG